VKPPQKIAEPKGKLGILLVGMGAVSTTTIAGVIAIRGGLAKPIGSLTQMGTIRLGKRTEGRSPLIKDFVPLASLDDIVFGGWDIFEENCLRGAKTAGVLEKDAARSGPPRARGDHADAGRVRPALREAARRAERQEGEEQEGPRRAADRRHPPVQGRQQLLDRLVIIWCGSTEVFMTESPVHATLAALRAGSRQRRLDPVEHDLRVRGDQGRASLRERRAEPERRRPGAAGAGAQTGSPLAARTSRRGRR
jgi:myo-inositol-1-phosphate synthase